MRKKTYQAFQGLSLDRENNDGVTHFSDPIPVKGRMVAVQIKFSGYGETGVLDGWIAIQQSNGTGWSYIRDANGDAIVASVGTILTEDHGGVGALQVYDVGLSKIRVVLIILEVDGEESPMEGVTADASVTVS